MVCCSARRYENDFEAPFLAGTTSFYTAESRDYLARNTVPDYVRKAERRLNEEASRVENYLSPSTAPRLMRAAETALIADHAQALVGAANGGAVSMLDDDKASDLRNLYDLLARVPATVEVLREAVGDHIKKVGGELVADQERVKEPVVFVKGVLAMRAK
jgi:cullin 3